MPDDIFDGIRLRLSGADPDTQWPRLSCSQANQMALERSDLRLDATREILLQGDGQIRSLGDTLFIAGGMLPEKLRIYATGNVGIGTTTPPTAKLEVAGTVKATAFQGDGSTLDGVVKKAGDTITGTLTVNNTLTVSGNVGIGTTPPSTAKLEVAGKIKATELEASGTVKAATFQGDGSALTGLTDTIAIAVTYNLTDGNRIDVPPGFTPKECIFSVAIQGIDFNAVLQLEKNRPVPFPENPPEKQQRNICSCKVDSQGIVSTFPKQGVVATGTVSAKKGGWQ